jgi:hypothetical protein
VTVAPCFNGGVLVDGSCNCPSGYAGSLCQQKIGKLDCCFLLILMSLAFDQIFNCAIELFVKAVEFVPIEIRVDRLNLFVFVTMVHQENIAN